MAAAPYPHPTPAPACRTGRRGFTLVELALCLVIVSVMTGFALHYINGRAAHQCTRSTAQELAFMQTAIDQFVAANGRYPRPATRNLHASDRHYGREVTHALDNSIARVALANPVLIGGVPHVTLGLPSELGADCWGHKFTYAVTETMTTTTGYATSTTTGGIILRYGTLSESQQLDSEAAYAIVSHGPDALGATPANHSGDPITCNQEQGRASVKRIDKENCDTNNATFYLSEINTSSEERFFDDYVVVANRPVLPKDCPAQTVSWGGNCSGPAALTLAGLSLNVTNTAAGYTGLALSICNNGVRSTAGVCLPAGACIYTSPRDGTTASLLTLTTMNYGTGVCKTYKCCNGSISIGPSPCLSGMDVPGIALSCP